MLIKRKNGKFVLLDSLVRKVLQDCFNADTENFVNLPIYRFFHFNDAKSCISVFANFSQKIGIIFSKVVPQKGFLGKFQYFGFFEPGHATNSSSVTYFISKTVETQWGVVKGLKNALQTCFEKAGDIVRHRLNNFSIFTKRKPSTAMFVVSVLAIQTACTAVFDRYEESLATLEKSKSSNFA